MMSLQEYRTKSASLADFLPWVALVGPGVVLNKDGSFQRTARFRGPDLDSATPAELVAVTSRLNNALRRLGSGWAVFVEAQRSAAQAYPQSRFPDPVSALVDRERREQFREEGAHFESGYYLTLLWMPPPEEAARAEGWLYEGKASTGVDPKELVKSFADRTDRVLHLVEGFMPEAAWLDDAATLTYLHSTVSTRTQRVRVPETPVYLDALLADEPLTGGLEPMLGAHHLRTLTITGFPTATFPGLLDELRAADPDHRCRFQMQGDGAAARAVAQAADKLGERQSVFSVAALHEEAGRVGLGKVSYAQVGAALAAAIDKGTLIDRTFLDRRGAAFAGFTTRQNVETEARMLRIEAEGRGTLAPIASPLAAAKAIAHAAAKAERAGFGWNVDQRQATAQLLSSRNRVTALQGYAGTAKTTTVLATFAREAEARGVSVIALAPTASAAMVLGEALGTRGDTVARHLLSPERSPQGQPAAWIVDEASLLSARDTARLLDLADRHNARVLLVGDVKQLGSVEAGAAFAQLQDAGMETARLAEIVRQTNAATREAVLASIAGDAKAALDALDRGGGQIIERADRAERFAAIAESYAALDKAGRARTLVIEPSREGRDALTADIRAALTGSGALTGPAVTVQSLANKGLTRAEARDPLSYDKGDVVRFTRDYDDKGVARGEAYQVESIDPAKAAITLKSEDGRAVDWRLRQWGAGKSQAFAPQSLELKAGDSIRFTRNDRGAGRVNGGRGVVISVEEKSRTATIETSKGRTETLNLDAARDRHIAHAYVETTFAAQGRTADHVIVHADSRATNLVDQKSFYVGISRAKASATVFTNDRGRLVSAISERAGQMQTAIAQAVVPSPAAVKAKGAGIG